MVINLDELNSNIKEKISICNNINFNDELIEKTDIIRLENVVFDGEIYKDLNDEFVLNGILKGSMYIEDSISLDEVQYDFSIDIDENIEEFLENNKNTIDILPVLWQNIVLEVPLRFTKVEDYTSYSGEGWKLISEEKDVSNNPFVELSKNFKEE